MLNTQKGKAAVYPELSNEGTMIENGFSQSMVLETNLVSPEFMSMKHFIISFRMYYRLC